MSIEERAAAAVPINFEHTVYLISFHFPAKIFALHHSVIVAIGT